MITGETDLTGAVRETIDHFGVAALNDPRRFRGMLLDVCGAGLISRAQRDRARTLCDALDQIVAAGMLADPVRFSSGAHDIAERLVKSGSAEADEAAWAVATWSAIAGRPVAIVPSDLARTRPANVTNPALAGTIPAQRRPADVRTSAAGETVTPPAGFPRGPIAAAIAIVAVLLLAASPLRAGATNALIANASSELAHDDFAGADRDAGFALDLDSSLGAAWNIRARVALARSDWSTARAEFTHAIALGGAGASDAWSGSGVAAERSGDRGGALTAYHHAIAADGSNAEAWGGECRILAARGSTPADEQAAAPACEHRLHLAPRDGEAGRALCAIDYDLDRWGGAITACGAVVALNAADATIYNDRGTAYFDTKRYDRAVSDFQTATHLRGSPAAVRTAWFGLTLSAQEAKRYSIAIVAGNRAATLYTNPKVLTRIYAALVYAYYYEHNRTAAYGAFQKYRHYKAASS